MAKEDKQTEEMKTEEKGLMEELGLEEKQNENTEEKTEETKSKEESKEEKSQGDNPEENPDENKEEEDKKESKEDKKESKEDEEEQPDLSEEDIKKLPKDAKGLYYAMKKEREKAKGLEAELQYLKLQNKYNKDKKEDKINPEEEIENAEDILKDKGEDDVVSVGEVKRILAAQGKKVTREKQAALDKDKEHTDKIKKMDELEDIFKESHSDYPEMLQIFGRAAAEMPSLRYEILAETNRENGNPAKKAYELGKKFRALYRDKKEDGKPPENNATRILKNAEKKKPSASVTGQSISKEALEEMDIEELQKTLSSMSMSEFMKVPKKIREKALMG